MEDIRVTQRRLAKRIVQLEVDIRNGNVTNLQAMKDELLESYKEFNALMVLARVTRKPGDSRALPPFM